MKKKSLNELVDTFEEYYSSYKDSIYSNYKTVDKFVELSDKYMEHLKLDKKISESEEPIFKSFLDSYVRSMYRRDFEKELMNAEIERYTMPPGAANFTRIAWAAIGGALGSMSGYVFTKNFYATAIMGVVVAMVGVIFAENGIRTSGLTTHSVVGTKEYEKQLRKEIYDALSGK